MRNVDDPGRLQPAGQYLATGSSQDDDQRFPPVTWAEIEAHLRKRLMMDDEWCLSGSDYLTWWPWFLAQQFTVTSSGNWNDDPDDNYLTVVARTPIARVDETTGLQLCSQVNRNYSLFTLVWDKGIIAAATSLSLNPLCRGLLSLFHEASLAQAINGHELALAWEESGLPVEILRSGHPESGVRTEPDELLGLFSNEGRADAAANLPELPRALDDARAIQRDLMMRHGWELLNSDHDVDFFSHDSQKVAIGRVCDGPNASRYGAGLAVVVPVTGPDWVLDPFQANQCALSMLEHPTTSLLGNLRRVHSRPDGFGTHIYSYLTAGFLGEWRLAPENLAVNVHNAAMHAVTAVAQFWREVEVHMSDDGD
jgi:hypothetical protein